MKAMILPSGVVVAVSTHAQTVENGIYMDGCTYADPNLTLVEVDGLPKPFKHKIVEGEILLNENYHSPADERLDALEARLDEKDAVIQTLILDALGGEV